MHVADLHRRGVEGFLARLDALDALAADEDDTWSRPTPCPGWDVRALVNHLVYEDVWTVPLMDGATMEEAGDPDDPQDRLLVAFGRDPSWTPPGLP